MIGKLFKYDFRVVRKSLFPLYIVALVLGIINRILLFTTNFSIGKFLNNNYSAQYISHLSIFFIQISLYFLFFFIAVGIYLLTYFIMTNRYYKSMYGNEGYLTNTLPVNISQLIWAKFLSFFIWAFISHTIILISVFILVPFEFYKTDFFLEIVTNLNKFQPVHIIGYILSTLSSISRTILVLFLCAVIANIFNRYKLLVSITSFFLINIVINAINYFFITAPMASFFLTETNTDTISSIMSYLMTLLTTIECIILFFITVYFHKNYLNLE